MSSNRRRREVEDKHCILLDIQIQAGENGIAAMVHSCHNLADYHTSVVITQTSTRQNEQLTDTEAGHILLARSSGLVEDSLGDSALHTRPIRGTKTFAR